MSDLKPWRVGETGIYVLGVEAVIDELTPETITLAGMTLPMRLNHERGIRYLSMDWPPDPVDCQREHCAGSCGENSEVTDRGEALERAIRDYHEERHEGVFAFCPTSICREVTR